MNIGVVLVFYSVEDRDRAVKLLIAHGYGTTTDPIRPAMVFKEMNMQKAQHVHRLLVSADIEYKANMKGLPKPKPQKSLSRVEFDNVAMPTHMYLDVRGAVRI